MKNLQLVKINQYDLSVKEYHGQRVVTFKDIDQCHGRPEGTAKRNFSENQKHLIQNVDYFEISRSDVGTNFVLTYGFNRKAPKGLLITESGYMMLVKSFTDDLAWSVQRQLVNTYFNAQAEKTGEPTTYHKALAEAKLRNSRAREASMWLKISQQVAIPEYKQICASYASGVLAGDKVIPLPLAGERHYKAGEIGEMFGVSANAIGKLANANRLKTDEYGKWYHDKSPNSSKEVDTFKYNSRALERFKEIIGK